MLGFIEVHECDNCKGFTRIMHTLNDVWSCSKCSGKLGPIPWNLVTVERRVGERRVKDLLVTNKAFRRKDGTFGLTRNGIDRRKKEEVVSEEKERALCDSLKPNKSECEAGPTKPPYDSWAEDALLHERIDRISRRLDTLHVRVKSGEPIEPLTSQSISSHDHPLKCEIMPHEHPAITSILLITDQQIRILNDRINIANRRTDSINARVDAVNTRIDATNARVSQ
jgi:hypothetical protein